MVGRIAFLPKKGPLYKILIVISYYSFRNGRVNNKTSLFRGAIVLLSRASGVQGKIFAFAFVFVSVIALAESCPHDLWAAGVDTPAPSLSGSEMRCLTVSVHELGTFESEVILRNTGSERPQFFQVSNPIDSPSVMLASAPGFAYDVDRRLLVWHGTVSPGEEQRVRISLVTMPGSAGNGVTNHAMITWGEWVPGQGFSSPQREDLQCGPLEVRSRERPVPILFTLGGIGLGWLEVFILGYILFAPVFVIAVSILVRRREKRRFEKSPDVSWHDDRFSQLMVPALSVFFVALLPFVLFFVSMLIEDVRRFVSYERTTCTILDKKVGHSMGSTGRLKSKIYGPLLSVRYAAQGKEIVSAGPPGGSGFSKKLKSAEKHLDQYELGKPYPCWFDPKDPQVFVLTRSPSWGWYLLGIFPVGLFFFFGRHLIRKLRGPIDGLGMTTPIR